MDYKYIRQTRPWINLILGLQTKDYRQINRIIQIRQQANNTLIFSQGLGLCIIQRISSRLMQSCLVVLTHSIDLFYNNNVDNVSDVWVIPVYQSDGIQRNSSMFFVLVKLIRLYVTNSSSTFSGSQDWDFVEY